MRRFTTVLFCLTAISASARAEVLIIDVTGGKKASGGGGGDLQLVMSSDSESAHKAAPTIVAQLKTEGYVVSPVVDYESLKEGRTARAMLHVGMEKMDQSCFVSVWAADIKSPENHFYTWETKDDSKPCLDQVKTALEGLPAARTPSHAPPAGPDAGTAAAADAGEAAAPAPQSPDAQVLAPLSAPPPATPTPTANPTPPAKGRDVTKVEHVDAPPIPKLADIAPEKAGKKTCGCQSGAGAAPMGALLFASMALLRRRRRQGIQR